MFRLTTKNSSKKIGSYWTFSHPSSIQISGINRVILWKNSAHWRLKQLARLSKPWASTIMDGLPIMNWKQQQIYDPYYSLHRTILTEDSRTFHQVLVQKRDRNLNSQIWNKLTKYLCMCSDLAKTISTKAKHFGKKRQLTYLLSKAWSP